jgi:uncharacterized protein (TIGR03067 family)
MCIRILCGLLLFVSGWSLFAAEPVQSASAVEGKWLVTAFTKGSEAIDGVVKLELVFHFEKDNVTITSQANKDFPVTKRVVKIDNQADPKLLDLAENAADFATGKGVHEGIYQLQGDELTWAFTQQGLFGPASGLRPANFDGSKDANLIVIKFAKQK